MTRMSENAGISTGKAKLLHWDVRVYLGQVDSRAPRPEVSDDELIDPVKALEAAFASVPSKDVAAAAESSEAESSEAESSEADSSEADSEPTKAADESQAPG